MKVSYCKTKFAALAAILFMLGGVTSYAETLGDTLRESKWDGIIGTWVDPETKGQNKKVTYAWKVKDHAIAREEGLAYMHEAGQREDLMAFVRQAFLEESGVGLRHRYAEIDDELFTEDGFAAYAEDALERMVNPFLRDPVDRVTRDPARKLGWEDRLVGSMLAAAEAGISPRRLARGVSIALACLCKESNRTDPAALLDELWQDAPGDRRSEFAELALSSAF